MEDIEFKIGDVVKCNSHEYQMTVGEVSEDKAWCNYFIESKLCCEVYSKDSLTIIEVPVYPIHYPYSSPPPYPTGTDHLIELITSDLKNDNYSYLEKIEMVEQLMVGVWNVAITSMEGRPNKDEIIGRVNMIAKKRVDISHYEGKGKIIS